MSRPSLWMSWLVMVIVDCCDVRCFVETDDSLPWNDTSVRSLKSIGRKERDRTEESIAFILNWCSSSARWVSHGSQGEDPHRLNHPSQCHSLSVRDSISTACSYCMTNSSMNHTLWRARYHHCAFLSNPQMWEESWEDHRWEGCCSWGWIYTISATIARCCYSQVLNCAVTSRKQRGSIFVVVQNFERQSSGMPRNPCQATTSLKVNFSLVITPINQQHPVHHDWTRRSFHRLHTSTISSWLICRSANGRLVGQQRERIVGGTFEVY